jgi:hypothetical protein
MIPLSSGKVWTRNILKPYSPEQRTRDMALWGDSKEKKPKAAKSKSKGTSASSSSSTSTSSSPAPLSSAPKKQKGATGGTDSSAGGKGKAAKTGKEGKEKEAKQKHVRTRTLEEDMARWQRENQVKVKVIRKKIKDPEKSKLKNLPRKLRRHLKSCTIETFAKMIYTPLYDNFLKTRASETIYKSLMKKVRRRAQQLMVDLDPEFGKRFFHQPNISYLLEHNETLSVGHAFSCLLFGKLTSLDRNSKVWSLLPDYRSYFWRKTRLFLCPPTAEWRKSSQGRSLSSF